jgi:hypothetical protein
MTTFVFRDGKVVPKVWETKVRKSAYVSRMETYESPIDGAPISSHRQRDLDLHKSNAYDVRDIGPNHAFAKAKAERKAENDARRSDPGQLDFWRERDR